MNTRQQQIVQLVNERGNISVSELSQLTGVSEVTIRQDLNTLEREHYLRRIHGSALALDGDDVNERLRTRFQIKKQLAEYAAAQIKDGESVFIEGGSTNALLARSLAHRSNITIITVSHFIAGLLKDASCEVVVLGGLYQKNSESVVGPLTRYCISQVHFHKAFIGTDGWHKDTGFTGRNMLRSDVISAVLDKGCESIVLSDSSKFGQIHPYPLSPEKQVSRVITDSELDKQYRQQLQSLGIVVEIVPVVITSFQESE